MTTRRRLYGRCLGVKPLGGPRVVWRFERAQILGRIYLDDAHRIAGLWFDDVRVPGDTWARLVADLKKLPGQASLTARAAGGRLLAAHRPDRALAVASAFKLYVLDTLVREIRAGRMRWDDVVQLRDRWRSLPPAPLNRWPDGAPLTVQSLATWMMKASDNTATDHLLHHVGRRVVERHAGTWNRPLLSTLEMFKLKSPGRTELAERYLKLPLAERRELLEQIASKPRRGLKTGWKQPRLVDRLEWFFSTRALCEVMLRVGKLPLWRTKRGPSNRRQWRRVAAKGGSEPGVRNQTLALQHRRTKRWYCLSITWNNPQAPLDHRRFDALVARALDLLWQTPATPTDRPPRKRGPHPPTAPDRSKTPHR
jgi:beta-lactamase class A